MLLQPFALYSLLSQQALTTFPFISPSIPFHFSQLHTPLRPSPTYCISFLLLSCLSSFHPFPFQLSLIDLGSIRSSPLAFRLLVRPFLSFDTMPDHVPANEMNAQFFHKRKNRRNRRMALGSHTNMHEEQHTFVPLSLSISFPLSISSPYFRLIIYLFFFGSRSI